MISGQLEVSERKVLLVLRRIVRDSRSPVVSCWRLRLLYDGACPICRREVAWLKGRDKAGNLSLDDISSPDFNPARYGLSYDEVGRVLHGVKGDGTIVKGLDAVREAYKTVGLGFLVLPTRLPVVRTVCDGLYHLFARYRIPLGTFLTGGCEGGKCDIQPRHRHGIEPGT